MGQVGGGGGGGDMSPQLLHAGQPGALCPGKAWDAGGLLSPGPWAGKQGVCGNLDSHGFQKQALVLIPCLCPKAYFTTH